MNISKKLILVTLVGFSLFACGSNSGSQALTSFSQEESSETTLTLEERLHNAYLDVIETKEENLRDLVTLTEDDERVTWNQEKDKVLLFTFHRYPTSYPDGEQVTFSWGESWVCSVKELENWYIANKSNIEDPLLRIKQVLGMSHESRNTYITSMCFDPNDVQRPAYVNDATKQMKTTFDENVTDEYKNWFYSQYYYSYDVSKLPWTRLGYTYDWSEEAKDKYGLTEFIAWKGTSVTVEKTLPVEEFLATFDK